MTRPFGGLLAASALALVLAGPCGGGAADAAPGASGGFDHAYLAFGEVLARCAGSDGLVDYDALRADRGLSAFLDTLAALTPEEVAAFSRDQRIAFYVNAFNALTLRTVVDLLPAESLRDVLPAASESARWVVGGRRMSLHEIEHKKLRRDLREPMALFALACGTRGCPALADRPLVGTGVAAQLDRAASAFLSDPAHNRIDRPGGRVLLSPILDWYGADFERLALPDVAAGPGRDPKEAALIRLLARYAAADDLRFLSAGGFAIGWVDFDWRPNAR